MTLRESVAAPASFRIRLSRPVIDGSVTHEELVLREPELRDMMLAARKSDPTEQSIVLVAALAGLSEGAAHRIKVLDSVRIQRWLGQIDRVGAESVDDADTAEGRLFRLLAPIPQVAGAPITELRIGEPDLGAAVGLHKLETEYDRTAALVARLSGHTIPQVARLAVRDLRRIEAWLGPFVNGTP